MARSVPQPWVVEVLLRAMVYSHLEGTTLPLAWSSSVAEDVGQVLGHDPRRVAWWKEGSLVLPLHNALSQRWVFEEKIHALDSVEGVVEEKNQDNLPHFQCLQAAPDGLTSWDFTHDFVMRWIFPLYWHRCTTLELNDHEKIPDSKSSLILLTSFPTQFFFEFEFLDLHSFLLTNGPLTRDKL